MQWQLLFFSMTPIAVFVVAQTFVNERRAIALSIVAAAIECGYNSYSLGFLETFSLFSFVLFTVLGALSIRTANSVFFKFQPVLIGVALAGVFLVYGLAFDTPLFAVIVEDHIGMKEVVPAYQRGYFSIYARTMSRTIPFLLLLHAALTGYAALKLSVWRWFLVRTVGLYLLIAVWFFAERLLIRPS